MQSRLIEGSSMNEYKGLLALPYSTQDIPADELVKYRYRESGRLKETGIKH